MGIKAKIKAACDKAEAKLEEISNDVTDFWNEHPRLILMTTFVSFLGLMTAAVASSVQDQREHPEKYLPKEPKSDFDILNDTAEKLGLQAGESCRITVDKEGNTMFKRTYLIPNEDADVPDTDDDDEPNVVEISQF